MTDDEALRALADLVGSGGWRSLSGPPTAQVVIRPWPDGTVDTLAFRAAGEALAERTHPTGHPVWRHIGPLTEVIAQIHALPAPDAPDEPRDVLRDGSGRAKVDPVTEPAPDDPCPHEVSAADDECAPVSVALPGLSRADWRILPGPARLIGCG